MTAEEIAAMQRAAEAFKARMGANVESSAPSLAKEILKNGPQSLDVEPRRVRVVSRPLPPQETHAERVERICARVIPAARAWAQFDHLVLAARVGSKGAIAATKRALAAPADRLGMVWLGPSGRGKTSLACAALRARVDGGCRRPLFVEAWKLATARARHPLGEGEPGIVEQAFAAELLVIDDLGSEPAAAMSAVPDVIFDRESRNRPTWFTMGLAAADISRIYGDGIARRVFERSVVIDCGVK